VTPTTLSREVALEWLARFEGAGLDGVVAKPAGGPYQPGKRAMFKVKHSRTAGCAVAGFRWLQSGDSPVGSLLLGLYDDSGTLHHVGVTSAFSVAARKQLTIELATLRTDALTNHPWRNWAEGGDVARMPGAHSRWSAGKDLSWQPLRVERVCEVMTYDHLQGRRFRHPPTFLRWRVDKRAEDCRYDQLEVTMPYELAKVFGAARGSGLKLPIAPGSPL
jgi:ATP-dependent DNA ligase